MAEESSPITIETVTLSDEQVLVQWATQRKISLAAVEILIKLGFNSLDALELISADDFTGSKIPKGQQKLILKNVEQLTNAQAPTLTSGNPPVTSATKDGVPEEDPVYSSLLEQWNNAQKQLANTTASQGPVIQNVMGGIEDNSQTSSENISWKDPQVYLKSASNAKGGRSKKKKAGGRGSIAGRGGRGGAGGRGAAGGKAGKKMTKEEKKKYKEGKRNADSDSEYSYRSVVSAGGTRHVLRRRKHEDGTYSDEHSYHSSQDEEGEARRRRRRRERDHEDSDHSYYSVVSAGGTRHVRRKKRHADGTYSDSESYHSPAVSDSDAGADGEKLSREITHLSSKGDGGDDDDDSSDYSYASEVSEGGTRTTYRKKRIRDEHGNVVGYGKKQTVEHVSDAESEKVRRGSIMSGDIGLGKRQKTIPRLSRDNTAASAKDMQGLGEAGGEDQTAWPGVSAEEIEKKFKEEVEKVPSDFSDASTDENVDLSKLTPAQRRQYLAEREKRRKEREQRRREKYGDKYDEIMKKRNAKRLEEQLKDKLGVTDDANGGGSRRPSMRRLSTMSGKQGRPKSMVTYDKGPPRDLGFDKEKDNREHGLQHDSWGQQKKTDEQGIKSRRRKSAEDGEPPRLKRETTMLTTLPTIPQGRIYDGYKDGKIDDDTRKKAKKPMWKPGEYDDDDLGLPKRAEKEDDKKEDKDGKDGDDTVQPELAYEIDKDGNKVLTKKKIDLSKITKDELLALGIDPNLSSKEIAKKLKAMFGKDVQIVEDGVVIGTKGIDEYDSDANSEDLANDPDLDVDTLHGLKRVNILMRRGGSALRKHLQHVIALSRLTDGRLGGGAFAKDLDERDADIDFLSHYRLVDPAKVEAYARAFVVEDTDLDTVINCHDTKVALDGIPSIQHITNKQMDYVMKVLQIHDATLVTFRMFAVITALCERVTSMDSLSQRLLEICNLADLERKLDLYKAMFYHNIQSDRNSNFITAESLKIELIAGGLSWEQQKHILSKMEPNDWGDISFLDYMCYIPLFLSMHDNICDNPLDMSNQKYIIPPRKRAASIQRDMNPLGYPLKKTSAFYIRKQAIDLIEGKTNVRQVSKSYYDTLNKYTSETLHSRLPKLKQQQDYSKDDKIRLDKEIDLID